MRLVRVLLWGLCKVGLEFRGCGWQVHVAVGVVEKKQRPVRVVYAVAETCALDVHTLQRSRMILT